MTTKDALKKLIEETEKIQKEAEKSQKKSERELQELLDKVVKGKGR